MKNILCVILGGGRGTRLYPLTKYRSKPAVPLAGKYRLIDIPISNCLNSGFQKIFVLTQFNSESLNRHISRTYKLESFSQGFVEIIAADQSMEDTDWFQGSADAVRKSLKHMNDPRIQYILILSADQLYKMNLLNLFNFHIEKKSEITIACNSVDAEDVHELGIMAIDGEYRIKRFLEKPKRVKDVENLGVYIDGKKKFLASMGIYMFNKEVLFDLLKDNKKIDFGKEVIPDALSLKTARAFIHNGYWKDIGSIGAFYEENLAFTDVRPPLDLFDESWQFFTRAHYLPLSKILNSVIINSTIAEGTIIEEAKITRSIIGLRSMIGLGSVIENSILMGNDYYETAQAALPLLGIGKNCCIKNAIVDKNVRIGNNVKISNEKNISEFENDYCVICNGIVVIPKNTVIPSGTVI